MPKPCAFQCTNTPGSFKCICPPGQHLLGDGKSCAGLERLPNYGAYYNSYNYAQFSPVRDNYQPQQYYRHSSNLYSSFSEYRNSRIPFSRTRRNIRETCPEGYEARNDRCVGKCQSYLCNSLVLVLILRLLFHIYQGLMVCGAVFFFLITLINIQRVLHVLVSWACCSKNVFKPPPCNLILIVLLIVCLHIIFLCYSLSSDYGSSLLWIFSH